MEPTEDVGIYYLIGDKIQEEVSIPEEIIDIDNELDIESLNEIDINEGNLEDFDFSM